MQLSIIIVNYNVKHFVEQCLHSVLAATTNLTSEIFVVDNNSKDGSLDYLKTKFSNIIFIGNNENVGFGKANNLALKQAKGDFILFLNPDTIVTEGCLEYCVNFFKNVHSCGAVGVRMLDGKGNFAHESKRAFPSVKAAIFKLTGLASLFPKSATFNEYALGHLANDKDAEVQVLSGAFLMISKIVANKTNGFDEEYFMYGEDIDLSFRIHKLGYKIFYLGSQNIIHFKGESTNKGSLNYIKVFYNAMSIFVRKNYVGKKASLFKFLINIGIWSRAFFSLIQQFIKKNGLIFIDVFLVAVTLFFVKHLGELIFVKGGSFNSTIAHFYIPVFTFLFIIGNYFSGLYDSLFKPLKVVAASISSLVLMLAFYSLLPENQRFSRGTILIGGFLSALVIILVRLILMKIGLIKNETILTNNSFAIVGSSENEKNIFSLNSFKNIENNYVGRIAVNENDTYCMGTIRNIESICKVAQLKEIIFSIDELKYTDVFALIHQLKSLNINFRFYFNKSSSIVGSDDKDSNGKTISGDIVYKINEPYQKRMKRFVDVSSCILFFVFFPVFIFIIPNYFIAIKNAISVLFNYKTWVGYNLQNKSLPVIKTAIMPLNKEKLHNNIQLKDVLYKADKKYAIEYDWLFDVNFLLNNYKNIGNKNL